MLQDDSDALLANPVLNIGLAVASFCFPYGPGLSELGRANDQDKTRCVPAAIYISRAFSNLQTEIM